MIDQEEVLKVSKNMIQWGGSFVSALGEALSHADFINQHKIKATWPKYWKEYNDWDEV